MERQQTVPSPQLQQAAIIKILMGVVGDSFLTGWWGKLWTLYVLSLTATLSMKPHLSCSFSIIVNFLWPYSLMLVFFFYRATHESSNSVNLNDCLMLGPLPEWHMYYSPVLSPAHFCILHRFRKGIPPHKTTPVRLWIHPFLVATTTRETHQLIALL